MDEEDSDYEDIYVPFSDMNFGDNDDPAPEEMEYTHVNAWERGDGDDVNVNALDSDIPVPRREGRKYQNLWSSEEDPRAIPPPAVICPVHHIGCKKGICEEMSKLMREIKRAEMKAQWEQEGLKKSKGTHVSFPDNEKPYPN